MTNLKKLITNNKFFLIILGMLMPSISFAQSLFTPTSGDLSVMMLSKLFGGLTGSGGADPLLNLITSFNSAVLAVGGILVAYTIFAGTIGTAHDGQMLGKKFSSAWVPLRTAIGTALVIPINGYCGMQYIVMWLVLQGVGMADQVWQSAVSGNALQTAAVSYSVKGNAEIQKLANDIFKSAVCTIASEKNEKEIAGNTGANWGQTTVTTKQGDRIDFGDKSMIQRSSMCGSIQLLNENLTASTYSGNFSAVNNSLKETSNLTIVKSHNEATREMITQLTADAQSFVKVLDTNGQKQLQSDINNISPSFISNAVNRYVTRVGNAAQSRFTTLDDGKAIATNATQEGWIMAGAWFMKIANQMSQINAEISNVPKSNAPRLSANAYTEEVSKVLNNVNSALSKDASNNTLGISKQNDLDRGEEGFGFGGIMKVIGNIMTGVDIDSLNTSNAHPILQAKAIGDQLINGSLIFIAGILSVSSVAGVALGNIFGMAAGGQTSFLAGVIFMAPIVFTIFSSLLGLGWFLAFYIPMLPFLIWMGALVGWFIMVVEAVIAAPLWAVMHLHPNGDDVTGRGGQGYMLVLGLLVRPTLMIFGLLSAIILSMVLGEFLNTVFFEVFKLSRNGDSLSFFTIMFAYVIYTTMLVTFVKKMFDIIYIIPDQLLQWIGGGGSQLGNYAGAMIQGSEGGFMKAGGAIGAVAQTGLPNAAQSMQNSIGNKLKNASNQAEKLHQAQDMRNDAARGAGVSTDSLSRMAGGGDNDFASLSAQKGIANSISDGKNTIAAAGGNAADQAAYAARFEQAMSDNPANPGANGADMGARTQSAHQAAMGSFLNDKFGGGGGAPSSIMNSTASADPARQAMLANKLSSLAAAHGGNTSSPAYQAALSSAASAATSLSSGATPESVAASNGISMTDSSGAPSEYAKAAESYASVSASAPAGSPQVQAAQQHVAAKAVNAIFNNSIPRSNSVAETVAPTNTVAQNAKNED